MEVESSPQGRARPGTPLLGENSDPPTPELPEEEGLILAAEDSQYSSCPYTLYTASPIDL